MGFTSENLGNYDFVKGFPGGSWVINKHDQKWWVYHIVYLKHEGFHGISHLLTILVLFFDGGFYPERKNVNWGGPLCQVSEVVNLLNGFRIVWRYSTKPHPTKNRRVSLLFPVNLWSNIWLPTTRRGQLCPGLTTENIWNFTTIGILAKIAKTIISQHESCKHGTLRTINGDVLYMVFWPQHGTV